MNKKFLILGIVAIIIIVAVVFIVVKNNKTGENNTHKTETSMAKNNTEKSENTINENSNKGEENMDTNMHHAKIEVKNYGTIELELDAKTAPITVQNFIKLVNEGFYNGLTFHRIMDGFMIQGGDPKANGTGGSEEEIKGEFKANGVQNNISHKRGVISMARATPFDSASSQFFIVQKDSTFLDGKYAGFGKVTSGMEIVDKICKDTKVEDNNGTVLKENQPIIEKIEIID